METIVDGVRIDGIPCQVVIETFSAYDGARDSFGVPLEPDGEAGWALDRVLDRKGYRALWLERKLNDSYTYDKLCQDIDRRLNDR